jgi:hypothetical protein
MPVKLKTSMLRSTAVSTWSPNRFAINSLWKKPLPEVWTGAKSLMGLGQVELPT